MLGNTFPGIDVEAVFLFIYRVLIGAQGDVSATDLRVWFYDTWVTVAWVSSVVTPVLLVLLAYVVIRYQQIRTQEMVAFRAKARLPHLEMRAPKNERWQKVLDLAASERPSDWRLAILEADVMLDELVQGLGYPGENLGERLKAIDRGDMRTLDAAWEAHKVRNEIAHAGSDFILTQREARRVIDLYRQVFEEFDFV